MDQLAFMLAKKQEIENLIKNEQASLWDTNNVYMDDQVVHSSYGDFSYRPYYNKAKEHGLLELLEYELEKINADIEKFYLEH